MPWDIQQPPGLYVPEATSTSPLSQCDNQKMSPDIAQCPWEQNGHWARATDLGFTLISLHNPDPALSFPTVFLTLEHITLPLIIFIICCLFPWSRTRAGGSSVFHCNVPCAEDRAGHTAGT